MTSWKPRYHQNFIKRKIDDFFVESPYLLTPVDTRKPDDLNKLARKMLDIFLAKHSDNTRELFVSTEIKKAREDQSYFPDYETDDEEKKYYFKLERWIDCLTKISERKTPPKAITSKTTKDLFINESAYVECINALSRVKDPVISNDRKYLLGPRQKGAFAAWYEVVRNRQKFMPGVTAAEVAMLLNKEIDGLDLYEDGTALRRTRTTMYNKYKVPFTKLIS